jgi:hypothetical protein
MVCEVFKARPVYRPIGPGPSGAASPPAEYASAFTEFSLSCRYQPCSAGCMAGTVEWLSESVLSRATLPERGDFMNEPKIEQGEQVADEFSDELLDEALDCEDSDAAYCTCGTAVCGTKCV